MAFGVHLHQEESKGACCTSGAEETAQYGQGLGAQSAAMLCVFVLRGSSQNVTVVVKNHGDRCCPQELGL